MNIPHNDSCSQTVDQHPVTQSHLCLAKCNVKVFEVSPVQHAFLAFVRGGQPSERRACEWLQAGLNQFRVYVKLLVCPLARLDLKAKQTVTILRAGNQRPNLCQVCANRQGRGQSFLGYLCSSECETELHATLSVSVCQWQDTVVVLVYLYLPFWCKGSVFDVFDAI